MPRLTARRQRWSNNPSEPPTIALLSNAICAEHEHGGERTPMQIRAVLGEDGVGDEDLPDTAENQLRWLTDAGFQHAEIHFKWGEAAVFGGCKPGTP